MTTQRVGYSRTSTTDQVAGLDHQRIELEKIGCHRIFFEHASSVAKRRPELEAALAFVREGDEFVVTKLDRLARSLSHLLQITEHLASKGVTLRILDMGLDTSTPTGRLMLGVIGSVAEFELAIMKDRQRVGIASAKADGRYKGRVPTARRQAEKVRQMKAEGRKVSEIVATLGISRASVFRVLKDQRAA